MQRGPVHLHRRRELPDAQVNPVVGFPHSPVATRLTIASPTAWAESIVSTSPPADLRLADSRKRGGPGDERRGELGDLRLEEGDVLQSTQAPFVHHDAESVRCVCNLSCAPWQRECVFDASTVALRLLCVCRVWVASGTSPTVDAILAEEKCSAGTA